MTGGTVSNRRNLTVPVAPGHIGYWLTLRLNRRGRRDAKKYINFQDTTATQTINEIEALATAGQHRVNAWLSLEIEPLRSGNQAIIARVSQINERVLAIERSPGATGRIRKANRILNAQLVEQRLNLIAQRSANLAAGQRAVEIAEEANQTWHRYFQAQAALYVRARSLKSKGKLPVSQAAIPTYTGINVLDIENFFDH